MATDETDETSTPGAGAGAGPGVGGEAGHAAAAAHPVTAAVRAMRAHARQVLERPLFSLEETDAAEALLEVTALTAQVAALEAHLAAHAHHVGVGSRTGAASTADWWACATRQDRPVTLARVRLARALESTWTRVGAALGAATINLEQARTIVRALEDLLGEDLEADLLARAEAHLVDLAAEHTPRELRILGERIVSIIAPQVGEERDRRRLEAAEAKAATTRRLTLSRDGHGSVHGRLTLPEVQGAMLEKILDAFASPAHHRCTATDAPVGAGEESDENGGESGGGGGRGGWVRGRPSAQRRGEALAELIETYPTDKVPTTAGVNGTIVVHINLDDLRTEDGNPGWLETGETISAAQTRRLACEAAIIPLVLGGPSGVLDAGLAQRLFQYTQRVAAAARDRECRAHGCHVPPARCHLHHLTAWAAGGRTDLINAALLCAHHHARIHDPTYAHTTGADNQITFHRRT